MMKKTFIILVSAVLLFFSCTDNNPVGLAGKGKIFITSIPPGAKISLNGASTGTITPDTIVADAGRQKISLSLKGYADTTLTVNVIQNQVEHVNVTLKPLGNLRVISDPLGAQIWLNGNNSGKVTPYTFVALSPGTYDVTFKLKNYRDTTLSVVVSFGAVASLNVSLTPLSSSSQISNNPIEAVKP